MNNYLNEVAIGRDLLAAKEIAQKELLQSESDFSRLEVRVDNLYGNNTLILERLDQKKNLSQEEVMFLLEVVIGCIRRGDNTIFIYKDLIGSVFTKVFKLYFTHDYWNRIRHIDSILLTMCLYANILQKHDVIEIGDLEINDLDEKPINTLLKAHIESSSRAEAGDTNIPSAKHISLVCSIYTNRLFFTENLMESRKVRDFLFAHFKNLDLEALEYCSQELMDRLKNYITFFSIDAEPEKKLLEEKLHRHFNKFIHYVVADDCPTPRNISINYLIRLSDLYHSLGNGLLGTFWEIIGKVINEEYNNAQSKLRELVYYGQAELSYTKLPFSIEKIAIWCAFQRLDHTIVKASHMTKGLLDMYALDIPQGLFGAKDKHVAATSLVYENYMTLLRSKPVRDCPLLASPDISAVQLDLHTSKQKMSIITKILIVESRGWIGFASNWRSLKQWLITRDTKLAAGLYEAAGKELHEFEEIFTTNNFEKYKNRPLADFANQLFEVYADFSTDQLLYYSGNDKLERKPLRQLVNYGHFLISEGFVNHRFMYNFCKFLRQYDKYLYANVRDQRFSLNPVYERIEDELNQRYEDISLFYWDYEDRSIRDEIQVWQEQT